MMMNHSKARPRATLRLLILSLLILQATQAARAQSISDQRLEQAIASLRRINRNQLTEAQREAKTKEIEDAWALIRRAGARGTARLRQEVERVERSAERDDFFKLNATALLWEIGKLNEAEFIARVWNSTPLEAQYNYVFYTAMEAAQTQDARVLPMLEAVLRDDKGTVYLYLHSLTVRWPLTHEFIWGTYGPKGLPRLLEILKTSKNPVETQSAIQRLTQAHYLEALPEIRGLAMNGEGDVRLTAIQALGVFGHPQDYDFLISGLSSKDPRELFRFAYALYEYDDLRAVPYLIPLLKNRDVAVRREVFAALTHLLTPEAAEALENYSRTSTIMQERNNATKYLDEEFREYGLSLNDYLKMPTAQRAAVINNIRQKRESGRYELQRGEKGLTRAEFLRAAAEWKKNHRLQSAGLPERIEVRHILSGATAADIPLLLEVKAAMYPRLSDEVLYETERIDTAVKLLGRSRYRKAPGITEKVEALN